MNGFTHTTATLSGPDVGEILATASEFVQQYPPLKLRRPPLPLGGHLDIMPVTVTRIVPSHVGIGTRYVYVYEGQIFIHPYNEHALRRIISGTSFARDKAGFAICSETSDPAYCKILAAFGNPTPHTSHLTPQT